MRDVVWQPDAPGWAEPFTRMWLAIQIVIEGPRGKDPYIKEIGR